MDETPQQSPSASGQEPKALTVPSSMRSLIEALIFAAEEPLSIRQLKAIYEFSAPAGSGVEERKLEADTIRAFIKELNEGYVRDDRPYRIIAIAGGYQFATLKDYADWLGKLRREQGRRRLSQSGVETLAIVAYKQPITKAEVEAIRGVNCDYVLKTLLEKELLTVTGRAEAVGRPLLYGTTREFLKHFGLNEITDLPRPREIEEILGETEFETERRMLEAQSGAEQVQQDEDFKSRLPHIPKRKPGLEASPVEIVPRTKRRELKTVQPEELPFSGAAAAAEPIPEAASLPAGPAAPEPTQEPPESSAPIAPDVAAESLPPPDTGQEEAPSRNRWQSWKEKIQGLIRRLFD